MKNPNDYPLTFDDINRFARGKAAHYLKKVKMGEHAKLEMEPERQKADDDFTTCRFKRWVVEAVKGRMLDKNDKDFMSWEEFDKTVAKNIHK